MATEPGTGARLHGLRGGPGENFSILGSLAKGDAIKSLDTKAEWIKIGNGDR